MKAEGENILAQVARLRGMPAKGPVQMNLISRKAAIDYYRAGFDAETRQRNEVQGEVYGLLGLTPAGTDITETFLKLLGTGILGFYDPDTKAFYLVDDLGGLDSPTSHTTVVHELTHALQDQYYDLNSLEKARTDANDWDGVTAFLDTIEGDAVSTEGAYRGTSSRRAPCNQIPAVISLPGIPYVIYRGLNTWYEDGYCFVESAAPDVSKRASVLQNIPTTTEQVLHPDKYKAGEQAKPVELVPLEASLGAGWSESARANLGEFVLQDLLVLGERNDRPKAARGAAGWGGDGWVLYAKDDARLIEVSTVWDSESEAREFYETLLESLSSRSKGNAPSVDDSSFGLQLDASAWRVGIRDDRVVMLVSTDSDALASAATQLGM